MQSNRILTLNTPFQIRIRDIFHLHIYILLLIIACIHLPKSIWIYYEAKAVIAGVSILGIWRYCWWSVHVIRSLLFQYFIFPPRRQRAEALWETGWRPEKLIIMMTTFNEIKSTTERVLQSILEECNSIQVPTKLFIGIGSEKDSEIIQDYFSKCSASVPFDVVIVPQQLPGKRFAIGETLRAILRMGLHHDDPVIFMDGDTFFVPGCLQKCLPFFALFPKMQALTTNEAAIVLNGPKWLKKWLDMRFVQRDLTMHSYSLSNKILTLTGRMSIFRGKHLLEPGFLEIIENDYLNHWLWGKFRFLSGDDKSTWYYLLKSQADMFYIPDATTITIEYIHGNPMDRMIENLRRWSGNTLRNGARAIALGPRRTGFFIWWCLIDQRISIWTMLIGHTILVILSLTKTLAFLLLALIWITFSRLCTAVVLFYYARRIELSYPFIIYLNQLLTAIIKVYILFRLPQQKWKNRGDQRLGFEGPDKLNVKGWVANFLTAFYCLGILFLILLYLRMIQVPSLADIRTFVL